MAEFRCPGQDRRFWDPDDIFEHPCPGCGRAIEFWKDDLRRACPGCGRAVPNPRLDLGCAEWCAQADRCAAARGEAPPAEADAAREGAEDGPGG